jgi:hypothetical protein
MLRQIVLAASSDQSPPWTGGRRLLIALSKLPLTRVAARAGREIEWLRKSGDNAAAMFL